MVDRRRIVRQWRQSTAKVLVTLVRAEGSSYRRPGAHLLIGADGEYAGTISGGCLEAEVVRKAVWKVRNGPAVERYSTMFDDTAEIPFGLGCGGVIDLLLEPVETPECQGVSIRDGSSARRGRSRLWRPGFRKRENLCRAPSFIPTVRAAFASDGLDVTEIASIPVTYRTNLVTDVTPGGLINGLVAEERLILQKLSRPQRLFVLGAGDDARPVVTMATLLGWNVTVLDGRKQLARTDRFPEAAHVLCATSVEGLGLTQSDAVVLMTHSYEQDSALLTGLLAAKAGAPLSTGAAPGYIGVLGAKHRSSLLVSEAAALLGRTVAECCERIYAPVGLDLGGDGPEAIALAAIAEVQAWSQGKLAQSRRLSEEEVALHIAQGGSITLPADTMRNGRDRIGRIVIAAVVLAAGASTRLGKPKQLVKIAGETLLERAAGIAREAGCSPVLVVLGAAHVDILKHVSLGDAGTGQSTRNGWKGWRALFGSE